MTLFAALLNHKQATAEKERLEAFLDALPGHYFGWAADGSLAYGDNFPALFGISILSGAQDMLNAVEKDFRPDLEGKINALREYGTRFTVNVITTAGAHLHIQGKRGRNLERSDYYDVLWVTDTTKESARANRAESGIDELRTDRDRLQTLLDHLPVPLWQRREGKELIWCNRAYAALINDTPAAAIVGQINLPVTFPNKKSLPAKAQTALKEMAQKAYTDASERAQDFHLITAGNRKLYTITEVGHAKAGMTIGFARDITHEEDLIKDKERSAAAVKELLEQLRTAIALFGKDQCLEFYNVAFAQLWRLDEKWLDTHPRLGDIMEKLREGRQLPEQADFRKFKQSWLDMFTGLIVPHEEMLYLPNDQALRMLSLPHPLGGLMITFEDVTGRLELESSYNTLVAVQKETLDNLAEGVAVIGSDGRLKLWNPSFASIWGLHPEDLENEPHITRLLEKIRKHFDPMFWPEYHDKLISLSLDRQAQRGHLSRSDELMLDYTTVPLPDGGVLITFTDVSDTVRIETALKEKNTALETAEKLKLDFLANVSYQLRTPLSTIMGFTEILNHEYFGPLNERQKSYTDDIMTAGDKLLNLINDILDLSTLEAGYMELNREIIHVPLLIKEMRELVTEWTRKANIKISISCAGDTGDIYVDPRRLKQVLLNLVRNAIAFQESPSDGHIKIFCKKEKSTVLIGVEDNGPGISQEDLERVFEPFERTSGSATDPESLIRGGAGLGLTLVRNIIELHGGSVKLDSEIGKGTTVTLCLPLADQNG